MCPLRTPPDKGPHSLLAEAWTASVLNQKGLFLPTQQGHRIWVNFVESDFLTTIQPSGSRFDPHSWPWRWPQIRTLATTRTLVPKLNHYLVKMRGKGSVSRETIFAFCISHSKLFSVFVHSKMVRYVEYDFQLWDDALMKIFFFYFYWLMLPLNIKSKSLQTRWFQCELWSVQMKNGLQIFLSTFFWKNGRRRKVFG